MSDMDWREPDEMGEPNSVQVHHEDITPADAGLFGASVSFTGPNAITWMDALCRISTLLSCNEDYARFDQDPANLKRWKYPPPPWHLLNPYSEAAARAVTGSTSTRMVELAPAHGHFRIADLPKELRDEVWLATEEPRILGADAFLLRHEPAHPRAVIIIATSGFDTSFGYHPVRKPRWDDIKLYGLCSEAHDVAIREYGQPSARSVPFRSAVDELLLDVGLEQEIALGLPKRWQFGECYRIKGRTLYVEADDGLPVDHCPICTSNLKVLHDPSVAVVVTAQEEFPCPDPRPPWLGAASPAEASIVMHRTYTPASADLLGRSAR